MIFQNNERKFYLQLGGDDTKTYQQPDVKKKTNDFGLNYGNQKLYEKTEWINDMTRELEGLEETRKRKFTSIYSKRPKRNIKLENARPR